MRHNRGVTLAEFLVAIVVLLLFFGVGYAVLLPVLTYLSLAQAKINTQQNAAPLLYKLQREVRQSDSRAVFILASSSPSPSATSLPSALTDLQTFAVASAKTGTAGSPCFPGGDFKTVPAYGTPYWQGFDVFMLQNAALKCVYEPLATGQQTAFPSAAQAATAISTALGVTNPPIFGNAVLVVKMNADPTTAVVDFQIKAVSTVNGRSNATTYTEDILTRN